MEKSLYTRDKLLNMMDQNNKEVDELMALFISLIPPMLDDLTQNIIDKDWQSISDIAHKLKSSMRLWGIDSLDETVVFIETYAHKEEMLEKVKTETTFLCDQLKLVVKDMQLELA